MKKELRPVHESVSCDVCGRTILKGEGTETYLSPDGREHEVCDLCFGRADRAGWIRASAAGDLPLRAPRAEPRRSLLGRLRRGRNDQPAPEPEAAEQPEAPGENGAEPPEGEASAPPAPSTERNERRARPRDPRHVRAVPTTREAKIERALDLFNGSEHQRTVAGLARTLGPAWVAVVPELDQPSSVTVVVAWELSWYRFRIDLADAQDPVAMLANGEEIEQIDEELRDWNATVDANGQIVLGDAVAGGGSTER
ncbi:MAG TPA: hypothetical protein VHG69_11700 [Thermoleophilaceae bacterium]|nr:hypothetical protein [Thermoleophilaceae bacterium]